MNILTEQAWKDKYKDYEGDGQVEKQAVLVEWEDAYETPREAILRLNSEVIKLSKEKTRVIAFVEGGVVQGARSNRADVSFSVHDIDEGESDTEEEYEALEFGIY